MPDPGPERLPAPPPPPAPAAPRPFASDELRSAVRLPSRAFDIVLGDRRRLAASIAAGAAPWRLAALLAACTAVASVPFALVRGPASCWRVAALYGGSVLVCAPSLQVFGAFLGTGLRPLQSLALALLVAATAALFALGFAPIAAFLQLTMQDGDLVDGDAAAVALLAVGLLAGIAQLARCVGDDARLQRPVARPLFVGWLCLLLFVSLRMARALDLLA